MNSTRRRPPDKPRKRQRPKPDGVRVAVFEWAGCALAALSRLETEVCNLRDEANKDGSPLAPLVDTDEVNSLLIALGECHSGIINTFISNTPPCQRLALPNVLAAAARSKGGRS